MKPFEIILKYENILYWAAKIINRFRTVALVNNKIKAMQKTARSFWEWKENLEIIKIVMKYLNSRYLFKEP